MNLNPEPFGLIANGSKTIELRLNDEKRQLLSEGDTIVFTNTQSGEKLSALVTKLWSFPSFTELYRELPLEKCGYTAKNIASASPGDMEQYYTKERQAQYGVLGIEIKVINTEEE